MIVNDLKKTTTKISVASIPTSPVSVEKYSHDVAPEQSANSVSPELVEPVNISATSPSSIENNSFVETTINDRKKSIMEHLKKSSNNFQYSSADYKKRNSKIREHIKNSLS